jgi:hypothetical protein
MRLSELLHSRVTDTDGRDLGTVEDVLVVQDGPLHSGFDAVFRVEGLVVGKGTLGIRLGFERAQVKGPWPLKVLFHWLERRARYVPWDEVEAVDGHTVRLSVGRDELGRPPLV